MVDAKVNPGRKQSFMKSLSFRRESLLVAEDQTPKPQPLDPRDQLVHKDSITESKLEVTR